MSTINLKELRQNFQFYIDKVNHEQKSYVVYKRSMPAFKLSPVNNDEWEQVIDFTEIKRGGVDIDDLLSRL